MDSFTVAELLGESPSSILTPTERSAADKIAKLKEAQKCTYELGYITQPVFMCRTCYAIRKNKIEEQAALDSELQPSDHAAYFGFCLGCSLNCHADHDVVELGDRARFRCDCGNAKCPTRDDVSQARSSSYGALGLFNDAEQPLSDEKPSSLLERGSICLLEANKEPYNSQNIYNHNFEGIFCRCRKPYDPSRAMRGCAVCHDYFHDDCINLMPIPYSPGILPPPIAAILKQLKGSDQAAGAVSTTIADASGRLWTEATYEVAPLQSSLHDQAQAHITAYFDQITRALADAEANVFVCAQCAVACPAITRYTLAHPTALGESISTCSRRALTRAANVKSSFTGQPFGVYSTLPHSSSASPNSSFHSNTSFSSTAGDTNCCIIGDDNQYHCQLVATCITCAEVDLKAAGACQSCLNAANTLSNMSSIESKSSPDFTATPSSTPSKVPPKHLARDVCVACAFCCHVGHKLVNWRVEGAAVCDCALDGKQQCSFENDALTYAAVQPNSLLQDSGCMKPTGDGNFELVELPTATVPSSSSSTLSSSLSVTLRKRGYVPRGPTAPSTDIIPQDGYDFAMCVGWKQRFCRCTACNAEMKAQRFDHAVEESEISTVSLKIKELETDDGIEATTETAEVVDDDASDTPLGQKRSDNPGVLSPATQQGVDQLTKRLAIGPSSLSGLVPTAESSFVDYWSSVLPSLLAAELKECVGDSTVVTKEMMDAAVDRVKVRYRTMIASQREQIEALAEMEEDFDG